MVVLFMMYTESIMAETFKPLNLILQGPIMAEPRKRIPKGPFMAETFKPLNLILKGPIMAEAVEPYPIGTDYGRNPLKNSFQKSLQLWRQPNR